MLLLSQCRKGRVHYVEKLDRKTFFLKLYAVKDNTVSKICSIEEKNAFRFPKQLKYRYLTCITFLWGGFMLHTNETNSFLKCFSYRTWEEISPLQIWMILKGDISHMSINPIVSVGIFWNYTNKAKIKMELCLCSAWKKKSHLSNKLVYLYG